MAVKPKNNSPKGNSIKSSLKRVTTFRRKRSGEIDLSKFEFTQDDGYAAYTTFIAHICFPGTKRQHNLYRQLVIEFARREARRFGSSGTMRPRHKALGRIEIKKLLGKRHALGAQVGHAYLQFIDMASAGIRPSLNKVVEDQFAAIPPYRDQKDTDPTDWNRSRRKMLAVFKEFAPVAHFWAAIVASQERDPRRSPNDIFRTLTAAEEYFVRVPQIEQSYDKTVPLRTRRANPFPLRQRIVVKLPSFLAAASVLKENRL